MKKLWAVIAITMTLLVGSMTSPMVHAMPAQMSDSTMQSEQMSESHDCCEEEATPCSDMEDSFCQQCEQHCAGQLGLMNPFKQLSPAASTHAAEPIYSNLPVITETLIRPPKHAV
ncbi:MULTISPECIES: hypothetical protein [Idiomarina]|jgi:hypothetical protein|uniref:hypothetical protein n=1 Tax=Idiomarina TaxID=135575 RepID=UPI00241CEA8B|nr:MULTISPECIES: hypothetical protein [Idiomarina]|tara:strand:+ start:997 stop:1341 length:345 start_codon:yes stop_codon:yes gene_type:complete